MVEPTNHFPPQPPSPDDLSRGLAALFRPVERRSRGSGRGLALRRLAQRLCAPATIHTQPPATEQGPVVFPKDEVSIPRYQVIGEIARGGVGIVLRGRDLDLGRDVAIKLLHEELLGDPQIVQRFVEEAQIAGQLQHPGIVPVYEMGLEEGDRPYFAMKLIHGETLAALLRKRADASEDRHRYLATFVQICQTVAYAHARGVVHRDLKPGNVMIGAFGEVQVVDWGFAKVLERLQDGTEGSPPRAVPPVETVRTGDAGTASLAGSVFGTPAYMPKEQALDQLGQMDRRSDVFSLGGMLCEILTGAPPYSAPGDVLESARRADLEPALQRLRICGADEAIVAITRACLAPDPEQRLADAGVLTGRVVAYLGSLEQRARAAELSAAEARGVAVLERRARKLTSVLATWIVGTLLLGGSLLAWYASARAEQQKSIDDRVQHAINEAMAEQIKAKVAESDGLAWTSALAAARHADDLARAEAADQRLMTRAAGVLAEVQDGHAMAVQRSQQSQRVNRIRARLARIRVPTDLGVWLDGWSNRESVAIIDGYREAFRDYGCDLELTSEERAAEILAGPDAIEFACALDHWATIARWLPYRGRAQLLDWSRMARIATRLDGADAFRAAVRAALHAHHDSLEPMRTLANDPRLAAGPSLGIVLVAQYLVSRGDSDGAVRALLAGQLRQPNDALLDFMLGRLLMNRGDVQGAARCFAMGHVASPSEPGLAFMLAEALSAAGQAGLAKSVCEEMLRGSPRETLGYWGLARACAAVAANEAAVAAAVSVVTMRPEDAFPHVLLANIVAGAGQSDRAIAEFETAIQLDPQRAKSHRDLAMLLLRKGKQGPALAALRRATIVDIANQNGCDRPSQELASTGDIAGAIAILEADVRSDPNEPAHLCHLANAKTEVGRYQEALVCMLDMERAAARLPNWPLDVESALAASRRLASREAALTAIAADENAATGAAELMDAAILSYRRDRYLRAAHLFEAALHHENPPDRSELRWHRVHAAGRAVAAAGRATDSGAAPAGESPEQLRGIALAWLREEFAAAPAKTPGAADLLAWLENPMLAAVRDPDRLAALPAPERSAWEELWREVTRRVLE